jgi:outer membrane protein assembly factor BamD
MINYPKTPANEDALVLMMESYDKLGMTQLRDDTLRVLKQTFPNGRYFGAATPKPWWKFWGKEEPPPLTVSEPAKPWWKFW